MESPINPGVWRLLFNVAVGSLSVAALFSIYHEKYNMQSTLSQAFRDLKTAKDEEELNARLHEILSRIQSDAVKKQAASRLSALVHGSVLVKLVKLAKDGSNAESCATALKVLQRVYGADVEGRQQLYKYDGYRVLLNSLSEAQRQGNEDLMEEIAEALRLLTQVDDAEVVLETDVPPGSEGAYALATMPATVKMLWILDAESPVLFLSAVTGIFANVCTLAVGARSIGKGTHGHSGISYFLSLLDHGNATVVENSMMAIRYMVRVKVGQEEVSQEENVSRLAANLKVNGQPATINSIFTVLLVMTDSEYGPAFFTNVAKSSIPATLFDIWMRSPEKLLRVRGEALCQMLSRLEPTKNVMNQILERNLAQIKERKGKDEQEAQRQQQQMQQQMYMQRMMMEQMGMDPSMMDA